MATNNSINNVSDPFTVPSGDLVVTTGNISTSANSITSATTLTASSGDITIASGNVELASGNVTMSTTSSTIGQILFNGSCWWHQYGTSNIFVGNPSGNFTFDTTNNTGVTCVGCNTGTALTDPTATYQLRGNTAFGYGALNACTSGVLNSCFGYNAGSAITTGIGNCILGAASGTATTTGNYNIILGAASGGSLGTSSSSNIYLGYGVAGANESNNCRLGNASSTACYIQGIYGGGGSGGVQVYVTSTGILAIGASSQVFKQNIADMGDDSDVLYQLQPRTFKFNDLPETQLPSFGMIAEEVLPVFPGMVEYDSEGNIHGLYYQFLGPMLVNELQKLEQQVAALEAAVAAKGK